MKLKKIILHITYLILISSLFSCGEQDEQLFNDKDAFFAFENSAIASSENSEDIISIPLYLAKSQALGDVRFGVVTEGYDNPAIEGVDYNFITTEYTVSFNGMYHASIDIELINNNEIDGDKRFKLVLDSNTIGASHGMANGDNSEFEITIIDDEHPLAPILGSYTLHWDSPWNGNDLEEENQIFSVEGSSTEVDIVLGYYRDHGDFAQCTKVRGVVDMDALTLSIAVDQETYNDGTHALTLYGDDEEPGGVITEGSIIADIDIDKGEIIFRTPFAIAFTAGPNEGYYEDLYLNPVLRK